MNHSSLNVAASGNLFSRFIESAPNSSVFHGRSDILQVDEGPADLGRRPEGHLLCDGSFHLISR